jgi:hypothetical protein
VDMMPIHKSNFTISPPPQFQELCLSFFRLYLSHSPSVRLHFEIFLAIYFVILYLSILLHAILNSLCISETVSNATNIFLPSTFTTIACVILKHIDAV